MSDGMSDGYRMEQEARAREKAEEGAVEFNKFAGVDALNRMASAVHQYDDDREYVLHMMATGLDATGAKKQLREKADRLVKQLRRYAQLLEEKL